MSTSEKRKNKTAADMQSSGGLSRRSFIGLSGCMALTALGGGFVLSGCTSQASSSDQIASEPETREITDLAGNSLTVPADIQSAVITSWKGALEVFVLLGHEDLVKGMSDTTRYTWLRKVYPDLASIPDYGNFDDVNIEEIVKANADIVFVPEAATKAIPQMQQLGLPIYVDGVVSKGDPYEGIYDEMAAIAELLDESDKARAFEDWETKWLDEVARRVSSVEEADRKTVLCLRNNTTEVFNDMNILGKTVGNAGGVNVAKDAFSDKFYGSVSAEAIVGWNPDFIFQYTVQGTLDGLVGRYQEMKGDSRFSGMKALDNGDFYLMPQGIANWGGKTESGLGALTMAKTMYPDKFDDVDIKDVAEDFYSTFMGCELTNDDWSTIVRNCTDAKEITL